MASIFKATDTESGAPVALKIPHMQFESDVVFFERFKREESIGQKLDHPHIVKVLKPRAKSRMYLAMEYVEGKSLRAIMQSSGKLPVDRALDIAQQVGEALVYLHGRKVVHRDLKPENVLLTADGQVKILDFGIALDETARRLTWAGLSSAVGTPDYMAPEQIGGRRGDERTDVYALGTMVFEMLAGDLPHAAPNPHALLSAKTNDDPRPLSYFLPSVDPALDAVVVRAIQRSPRDRYQTVAQFLTDLRDPKSAVHADGSRTTTPARRPLPRRAPRGGPGRGGDDLRRADRAGRAQPPGRAAARARGAPGEIDDAAGRACEPSFELVTEPGLGADRRVSRDVHAGRLRDGRDRLRARQERRPRHGDEHGRLSGRRARLLAHRLRVHDGRRLGLADAWRGGCAGAHELGLHIGGHLLRASSARRASRWSAPRRIPAAWRCSCSPRSSWTRRRRSRPARWPSAGGSRRSSATRCSCR